MRNHSSDVLVLGGGVIGLSIAYYCSRLGLRVVAVEKSAIGSGASGAAAGILPYRRPGLARKPEAALMSLSVRLYPDFVRSLEAETSIDCGYNRCGELELALDSSTAEALHARMARYQEEGVACERLRGFDISELEPCLRSDVEAAYYLPETAQLRCSQLLRALVTACERRGARIVQGTEVDTLEQDSGRFVGARAGDEVFSAEITVLATGAWSSKLLASAGLAPDVRPIRGQIVLLKAEAVRLAKIVSVDSRYIVPWDDGHVLVGSTEEDVGFDCRTSALAVRDLLTFAVDTCPVLGDARLERAWAGLRPRTPDRRPWIGSISACGGLLIATGHYRSGIQLAPATAYVVSQLVVGEVPALPLYAFRPGSDTRAC